MTKTVAPERAPAGTSQESTPGYETLALYIDGEFIAGGRKAQDVRNPATGDVIGKLPPPNPPPRRDSGRPSASPPSGDAPRASDAATPSEATPAATRNANL